MDNNEVDFQSVNTDLTLISFVPEDMKNKDIELVEDLIPVVERINDVISPDLVWDLFASTQAETKGKIEFPYYMPGKDIMTVNERLDMPWIIGGSVSEKEFTEWYIETATEVFGVLVWIEVGFLG